MAEPAWSLLLLTGRMDAHGELGAILEFVDRLGRFGISATVLSVSRGEGVPTDPRVVECPGLGNRWQQAIAVRRLRLGEALDRPDLLHVLQMGMAPAGLALAEHWRLPYIQTVDEFLRPRDRLRLSRGWCRKLVAVSGELADDLRGNYGVPDGLLAVVCQGLSCPGEACADSGDRTPLVPVIGTAGPLVPASGFATFLSAARRVLDAGIDAEFVIAGQGEDEVDLRRRADRLRIADRVTFASHALDGLRFWNVLDVFCQTSLVPTVGRALAMAMANGVPSIASDVGGLRTLIDDGVTGLRVPADNSAALAETILALLHDRERARTLGRQGRQAILDHFDPDDEVRGLDSVYRSVLEPEASAPVRLMQPAGVSI